MIASERGLWQQQTRHCTLTCDQDCCGSESIEVEHGGSYRTKLVTWPDFTIFGTVDELMKLRCFWTGPVELSQICLNLNTDAVQCGAGGMWGSTQIGRTRVFSMAEEKRKHT